jgi:TolA-binding protein
MNMYHTRLLGINSPSRARAGVRAPGTALLLLACAACGGWPGAKGASHGAGAVSPDLLDRIEKQQIVIDDLGERITDLENTILQQAYELKKLKKIVKKDNMASISLPAEEPEVYVEETTPTQDGGDAQGYSIFMELSASDEDEGGGTHPVLTSGGASPALGPEEDGVTDVGTLMKEATMAAAFVPLKLGTMPAAPEPPAVKAGPAQAPAAAAPPPKPAVDPYEAGQQKYLAGKWSDAALYFDIFIKGNPDSVKAANAYFLKAECLFQAGRTVEALGAFEIVETKFSNFSRIPEVKFRIGRCYEILKDKSKAKAVYESIVQDFPKSGAAAKALKRLKDIKKGG